MTDLLVIVGALAVGSFVKGVTGTGLPQVAVPVMAAFLGVERAVIIMSIPGVVSNLWLVVNHVKSASQSRHLLNLLFTGVIGAVVGTVALTTVDGRLLSLVLAALILVYVVLRVAAPRLHVSRRASFWLSPPIGLAAGALQGSTGISGPLLATYIHSLRLTPGAYVFSLSALFGVFSVAQVATLAGLGAYSTELLLEGLLALVPVAAFLVPGVRLGKLLDPAVFGRVVLAFLGVAAGVLVWQGLAG
ncbi:sulfite exporter TauE/SafE family protein [Georgenia yuyongxinii]|uniref:Probable membrane transporter protein n=1 Tax=Georgenia yuyongxinii TaxID=2589797 RepID=A0A5B8C6I9_9MICO|nr:sulfite exporter TauE/SafE family protein [Georgenia yuyongxinii]QDC24945.1 sulfite exporter TauE/SafE family protein [Georgenia yuyongxinii]